MAGYRNGCWVEILKWSPRSLHLLDKTISVGNAAKAHRGIEMCLYIPPLGNYVVQAPANGTIEMGIVIGLHVALVRSYLAVNKTPCRYSRHSCKIRAKVAKLPTSSNAATRKGKIKILDKVPSTSFPGINQVMRIKGEFLVYSRGGHHHDSNQTK